MKRALALLLFVPLALAQTPATKKPATPAKKSAAATKKAAKPADLTALERNVRGHLEFLASDALQGRRSATRDEQIAGAYMASQLRQFGVEPAGDTDADGNKSYLQRVPLKQEQFAEAPTLTLGASTFTHGKEMAVIRARTASVSGPLQKLKPGDTPQRGAVAYIHLGEGANDGPVLNQIMAPLRGGAAAVVVADAAQIRQRFAAASKEMPELPLQAGGAQGGAGPSSIVILNADATAAFEAATDGATVTIAGKTKSGTEGSTWNVIGVLPGSDPKQAKEVILLSAHMDHVGVNPNAPGDDKINNGADDDASGCAAVLELARKLASGPRPKRTVYFVTFGSEERGGHGAQYFLANPPVPLTDIAANLEFEMIGRPDPKVAAETLWLTGWERTNLGPELAKMGARIVADPHPDQNFFMRSDNFALARRGVVAQTVSSFGLHKEYHTPADEVRHIDFAHMARSINSMLEPVLWLANSTFKPDWLPGKKP